MVKFRAAVTTVDLKSALQAQVDIWFLDIKDRIKKTVEKSIRKNFSSESAPDGKPWADLAPSTIRRKRRLGQPLKKLVATGAGKKSVKVTIVGNQIQVRYACYMRFHQSPLPRKRLPRRQFAPTREDFAKGTIGQEIKNEIRKALKRRTGR